MASELSLPVAEHYELEHIDEVVILEEVNSEFREVGSPFAVTPESANDRLQPRLPEVGLTENCLDDRSDLALKAGD